MKIAIDIRHAGGEKTGKGWYTFNLIQNLLQLDQENEYFLYSKEPIPGFEEFKNAQIKIIKFPGIFWHHFVARDCKKENIELFFAPSSYIIPAILPHNIKSIITVHDLVAFLFPKNHNSKATIVERIFLKRALKKAHHVITVSQNTKHDLLNKFDYPPSQISVIPCAAAEIFHPRLPEDLQKFAQNTQLPEKFFLAVGTIEPRKNYLNLIKAFAHFAEDHQDYHLIIVGGNGWQTDDFYQEIRRNYLQKKVHVLGYLSINSIAKLYNLAQALVFPSFYEGFGMPPLEAMQSGCPVICSKTSSLPEVVGENGLYIDPTNHFDISAKMHQIVSDPTLRPKLAALGIKHAQNFSWRSSAEKLLKQAMRSIA